MMSTLGSFLPPTCISIYFQVTDAYLILLQCFKLGLIP